MDRNIHGFIVQAQGRTLMRNHTNKHSKYGCLAAFLLLILAFPRTGQSQNTDLQKLFSDYYEFQLREDPGQATFIGRSEYNDRWDDPSPEHLQQYRNSLQQFLGRLRAIPEKSLTGQDRLSYRLLDWQLEQEIADTDIVSTYFSVNHLVGGHLNAFSTMAVAPAITVKDYENQVARLRALPHWVDQTIAAANLAIAQKKIQPRLDFLLRDGQIRSGDGLIHPMRQRAQAGHLIFVIFYGDRGGDGHRAECIQMPAHEMIDAEVRRNNVRVRDLLFELPIQKPVAQAVLPCKGFLRDGPQAPEELLQRIAVLLLVLW